MKRLVLLIFVTVIPIIVSAAPSETLATHHWAYEIINELQVRGNMLDLSRMNLPYTRGQVAESLIKTTQTINNRSGMVGEWLTMLEQEFSPEIKTISGKSAGNEAIQLRLKMLPNLDHNDETDLDYKGIYRGGVGVQLTENLFAFSGVNFNQYDVDNEDYVGYEWRGVTGYTEQAYITYQTDRFYVKFGRDYIRWGAGNSGKLVMSDIARPLDQLYTSLKAGPLRFSFFASQLDDLGRHAIDNQYSLPVRRFLSGHRLDVSLWNGKFQAAVSELMLYGGAGENFNAAYINPFIFWHGANYNNKTSIGNVLPTLDLMYYPSLNKSIYFSLLIDDMQVEETGPIDLEPNEIGYIVGFNYAGPFNIEGLGLNIEYARVANRTYKTPNPVESFLHRDGPLGHPLGNDFDHIMLESTMWLCNDLRGCLDLSYTRHGEGSLYTPWDAPWMAHTVKEGYSEPFPTGVVEKTFHVALDVKYYYRSWLNARLYLSNRTIKNYGNINGESESLFSAALQLELLYDYCLIFK